jgi:hypothetical protein
MSWAHISMFRIAINKMFECLFSRVPGFDSRLRHVSPGKTYPGAFVEAFRRGGGEETHLLAVVAGDPQLTALRGTVLPIHGTVLMGTTGVQL